MLGSKMYPLLLKPVIKDYLWGGTKLKHGFGFETDKEIVADVVVPRNKVAEFIEYPHALGKELNIRIPSFGHAGDGNLHVYVCKDGLSQEDWKKQLTVAFSRMYKKANELCGLVSGEHGIGFAKNSICSIRTVMSKSKLCVA